MESKKSKIKVIESVNEWNGRDEPIYYHNLEMENGDKISIGKKKALKIGWELDYQIIEPVDGEKEYKKAKSTWTPPTEPVTAPAEELKTTEETDDLPF